MNSDKAQSYFHGKEEYNCAQAVLKAFQEQYDIPEATINEYKEYGGGRAKDGTCGALFAALALVSDSQKEILIQAFEQQAQYTTCERIKDKTISCRECVGAAAEALRQLQNDCK